MFCKYMITCPSAALSGAHREVDLRRLISACVEFFWERSLLDQLWPLKWQWAFERLACHLYYTMESKF